MATDTEKHESGSGVDYADWLAVVAFLAGYQEKLNRLRGGLMSEKDGDKVRDKLVMEWPVIQGTQNQIDLARLGEMKFDYKRIGPTIKKILSPNVKVYHAVRNERN